ncbi:MAG: threonine ammonia-lyase [Clostridiales bacterium]|jgi:threonine dehydratase|nr:threonine ammonia-lyase [Clostridiales bacterium]
MLTLDKVYHAAFVLRDVIRKTDLIHAPNINPESEIYLKTENLQVTGSFKVRGAYYKISQLSEEEKAKGVIACSAGNHAQGVALAATKNGIQSLICIPDGAPISKVEATKKYGADVLLVNGVYDDAYNKAREIQEQEGSTFIHPFDDEDVIAGQGSIGLELLDQLPDLDAVIVPIGGGGLIGGVAFAIKSLNPNCKVYGVQASGAPSMYNSIARHERETLSNVSTIADGIAVKQPGQLTYELCEKYVDEIVTVTDDEVSTAILALIEQQKLIAEGAGAVAVAAALFNKVDVKGKKVVCLVSGGNIDVTILSRVITRGLLKAGRSADITVELMDKPGQLRDVSAIIAELGGNVVSVHHDRSGENTHIDACYLHLVMETKDHAHIAQIRKALTDHGYKIISQSCTYLPEQTE